MDTKPVENMPHPEPGWEKYFPPPTANIEFIEFDKISRLSRPCVITEKIDGTNGCVYIGDDGYTLWFGSRTKWLTPKEDNHGFWKWCNANTEELLKLGPGRHYGEWWGSGIQRRYGLTGDDKRFSLFNTARWGDAATRPACCSTSPILYQGIFSTDVVEECLDSLRCGGSKAAPGFMNPEGVVIWHEAARVLFKKTLDKDDEWKGKQK